MNISLLRTDKEMADIYNKYVDTIYRIALMILKKVPEAEDATQTVFIKLMTSNSQFESDAHMKAWLIVTAQNTCKDLLKGWWCSKKVDFVNVVEQTYYIDAFKKDIWYEVLKLEDKYIFPIYLYYYEGYETAEIAKILKINHATLRTRLRTAKKRLKLLIEEDIEYEQE